MEDPYQVSCTVFNRASPNVGLHRLKRCNIIPYHNGSRTSSDQTRHRDAAVLCNLENGVRARCYGAFQGWHARCRCFAGKRQLSRLDSSLAAIVASLGKPPTTSLLHFSDEIALHFQITSQEASMTVQKEVTTHGKSYSSMKKAAIQLEGEWHNMMRLPSEHGVFEGKLSFRSLQPRSSILCCYLESSEQLESSFLLGCSKERSSRWTLNNASRTELRLRTILRSAICGSTRATSSKDACTTRPRASRCLLNVLQ